MSSSTRPSVSQADIIAIVAERLGVDPGSVDVTGDLIAQGLDSIHMMAIAGRWRRDGADIDFARLLASPTVADWAALLGDTTDLDTALPPAGAGSAPPPDEPFPLAPMQHAMWVGRDDRQPLGGVAAHLYAEFDGHGVDPERLQRAATLLVARHPMLRVEFLPDGTQRPTAPPDPFPVEVTDLRDGDATTAERRLAEIRDAKTHQQLDGAVLEVSLTLLPGGATRLHIDLDMQAADALSYRTFTNELATLYDGGTLPELGYTHPEYRSALGDFRPNATERDRTWWAERTPELPDAPALPLVPAGAHARRSNRRWHWLDPDTREALFARAHRRGLTPAMTLAASYADTIGSWSSDPRFLLNVPLFGREPLHPEVGRVVGDFSSSLMLDVDFANCATATDRARALQHEMHTAASHSTHSGLSVLRDLSRHRGTQVLAPVVFTSALGLGSLFAGDVTTLFGTPVWIISQGPQVLIDTQVTEFRDGLLINWDVREHHFAPGVIDAMFERHLDEVTSLAAGDAAWDAPRRPLASPAQRRPRDEANTATAPRSTALLSDGFFAAADRTPDAVAVVSAAGTWSYAELRARTVAVAAALQTDGMQAGDTVAVLGPKNADQLPALLAISAVGGVYLPIGVDQPADRAARIIATGDVRRALVTGTELPSLPVPAMTVADAVRRGTGATFTPIALAPAEPAYVLFTSGSTGEPKGVEVSHAAAMNTIEFLVERFELGPDDTCLALSTLEGDLSVVDVFGMLGVGSTVVVVDESERRNPDAWVRLIDEHRITVLHFMPGWLEMLVQVAAPASLSSLRVVPTGGDWVRPELVRKLRAHSPGLRFAGLGGATETATHNTVCEVGELPPDWVAVPFGVPLPNNACRVVNARGEDCPDWVPGELWVGGRGIANGYRGRPDLTQERFVHHDGIRWYRTGDLARYRSDGLIEFVGRVDHRVKLSGYRVELGEVEAALRRVEGVTAAVASVLTVAGAEQLGAIATTDRALTPADIRTAVAEFVPDHMVPKDIRLVDAIPYTVGGKTDRTAVARLLAEAVSAPTDSRTPTTPLERALASIIGSLVDAREIGLDDDFFTLGGDSVTATAAVARIRSWLDTSAIAVADVFANRTVGALAQTLGSRDERLDEVAELFLEVAAMDADDVTRAVADDRTDPPVVAPPVLTRTPPMSFAPWIRRFTGPAAGGVVVFPHAGSAAATYRPVATAFATTGPDVFVVQYPQHPGRLRDPAVPTVADIAEGLFAAGPWERLAPLRLFGHCMGAVVAFEFAKLAERHGIEIAALWASGGAAPSVVAAEPPLPTTDAAILADLTELGGTDQRLLADPEFVELLIPAVRADYEALNRYSYVPGDTVAADVGVIGARGDHRVSIDQLLQWKSHTTGRFAHHQFDGGHFSLFENLDVIAKLVEADV